MAPLWSRAFCNSPPTEFLSLSALFRCRSTSTSLSTLMTLPQSSLNGLLDAVLTPTLFLAFGRKSLERLSGTREGGLAPVEIY